MKQKDFLGKELEVGDSVIFIEPGYRNFQKGVIFKFTEKMIFINWKNPRCHISKEDTLKQCGYQVVKIEETIDTE
jgi:hypothetical protein